MTWLNEQHISWGTSFGAGDATVECDVFGIWDESATSCWPGRGVSCCGFVTTTPVNVFWPFGGVLSKGFESPFFFALDFDFGLSVWVLSFGTADALAFFVGFDVGSLTGNELLTLDALPPVGVAARLPMFEIPLSERKKTIMTLYGSYSCRNSISSSS